MNFHFWPYCKFKCKYCFLKFEYVKRPLSKKDCMSILLALWEFGAEKINFVGGEPTLCPFLGELIAYAKNLGFTTSIVSNGTVITPSFLRKYGKNIDWIGLSLDSGNEETQKALGRGNGNYVQKTINKSLMIKKSGIKLKINTVITRLNVNEDMSAVINKIAPDRWKVFQMLIIKGQNDNEAKNLTISSSEFKNFTKRYADFNPIAENNDAMVDSYIMIDPLGRFFQNSGGTYSYSMPILQVGVFNAFDQITFNHDKFIKRGGIYSF
ncbi:MAG: viperin family antiviral radical SAM protein [Promethearchaeota archaeon]